MITLKGKSVYPGICMGRLYFYSRKEIHIRQYVVNDREDEKIRFERAVLEAASQLKTLAGQAGADENGEIFDIHAMLLMDQEYQNNVKKRILIQGVNAEYAVSAAGESFLQMFHTMDDAYMRERAADMEDITRRLLHILTGEEEGCLQTNEPVIVAADDLSPSETVKLPRGMVLGFIMRKGSLNSHTAILAKSMGIPALVNVEGITKEWDGRMTAIDGEDGRVWIEPDEATISCLTDKKQKDEQRLKGYLELRGKENVTLDGRHIRIYANAGSLGDVDRAIDNDAGGIGLLRSEILYLGCESAPDEERQFVFYRDVLRRMAGRDVMIRTMDIGADKQADYLKIRKEDNPALGLRAIRIGLKQPKLFKTQLRALYRAGIYGKLSVIYPMVTSTQEVVRIRKLEQEARDELKARGESYAQKVPTGIMIETPAAALISDELARLVDFFSIGTNDLTQYTLAADRQNSALEEFCDSHHKAVIRLIEMTVCNAKAAGIPVDICGELAGDMSLTEKFLKMGVDMLSVAPGLVLPLRSKIRQISLEASVKVQQ